MAQINMEYGNLRGEIPEDVGAFVDITRFVVGDCNIRGALPVSPPTT